MIEELHREGLVLLELLNYEKKSIPSMLNGVQNILMNILQTFQTFQHLSKAPSFLVQL